MATQDELIALLNQHLSFEPQQQYARPQPEQIPGPIDETIVYSSCHYTHSAHIRPAPSRPASEPPQSELLTVELVLCQNGVDPSALYPSQIDLFRTADEAQQLRLVELWRICPPEYSHNVAQSLSHNRTSMEQEESLAKLRYERHMMEERLSRTGGDQAMDSDAMSDASTNQPLTPIQGGDSRWGVLHAEPYMASGYEALAAREYTQSAGLLASPKDTYNHYGSAVGGNSYHQATDPVYASVGGDWEALVKERQRINQQSMENQYGAYQQQHQGGQHGEDAEML